MKKLGFFLTLIAIGILVKSQELVLEQSIDLNSTLKDKREVCPIYDEKDNLSFFFIDNKKIHGYLFNKNFDFQHKLACNRPGGPYKLLIGDMVAGDTYSLLFSNGNKTKFSFVSFNYQNKEVDTTLIELELKTEDFIETIRYNEKLYILTIKENSSTLRLYIFSKPDEYIIKEYNFPLYTFSPTSYHLSRLLKPSKKNINLKKISANTPNTIEITSRTNKIFLDNHKIILTLNNYLDKTTVIALNLEDYSSDLKPYYHSKIDCNDAFNIKSNSFVYKGMLYQLIVCSKELCFSIYDMDDGTRIKEYRVKKEEEIGFKNSSLIQEGGYTLLSQGQKRQLEKTKQMLRKMSSSSVGISVYEINDTLEVTIGGYSTSSGMGMSAPPGILSIPITNGINLTYGNFYSYTKTKAEYFTGLFDKTSLNHLEGNVHANAFDKIRDFIKEVKKKNIIITQTVFKNGNDYILGFYKQYHQKYYLYKFSNITQ